MWSRWGRLDSTGLDTYLRRTITNTFLTSARRRSHGRLLMRLLPMERSVDSEDAAVAQREDLAAALRRLPPRQRVVIALRYIEDLPVNEVAEALGCSPGTVKTQTSRGLAALRRHLTAEHGPAGGVSS